MSFYILLIFGLSWLVIWGLIIFQRYHQELKRYWLEPILKYPVLIFESDDWGAGPLVQSHILKRIAVVLGQYTDKNNHHPIMTLAVILSIPDSDKIKKENS